MRVRAVAGFLVLWCCTACTRDRAPILSMASPAADEQAVERLALGTRVEIVVRDPDFEQGREAIELGFAEIDRLDAWLSESNPASEITRIGKHAGEWQPVSAETIELLRRAKEVAAETDGAFDPTLAPLLRVFGFAGGTPRLPSPAEIDLAKAFVDWRALELDESTTPQVRLARAGMEIGVGAIARGFILDRAAARLRERGVPAARLRAGSDHVVYGGTAERPWPIAIEDPDRPGEVFARFDLQAGGVSTAAPAYQEFDAGAERTHPLLDPRTGRPARGVRSVTVVAPDALLAHSWALALFVLGRDAHAPLTRHPELQSLVVLEIGFRIASPGLGVRFTTP